MISVLKFDDEIINCSFAELSLFNAYLINDPIYQEVCMIFGVLALGLFFIWILRRLNKASIEYQNEKKSIEVMLHRIESKLNQLLSSQKEIKSQVDERNN